MWEISVGSQVTASLYSVALGAMLCMFYDVIRATRKAGADSFAAVFIGDIVFWLVSAVAVFVFLMGTTDGEIRGYVLFFAAAGFIICRLTVGRPLFFLLEKLFCFLATVYKKGVALSAKGCLCIDGCADKFFHKINRLFKLTVKKVKKLLKSIKDIVYTETDKKKAENDVDE